MKRTPIAQSSFKRPTKAEPKTRKRRCAICRSLFTPRSMTHKACGEGCALALGEMEKARKLRKERQAGLAKLKTKAAWMKEAQAALNAWIRLVRDRDLPCISCGRHHQGQYHAGHFLSRGAHPNLALVENNLAKQCMPCNVHLSGNQINFRHGLIARIGLPAVEALESDCVPRKWSIDDLKEIKNTYRDKLKELKNA